VDNAHPRAKRQDPAAAQRVQWNTGSIGEMPASLSSLNARERVLALGDTLGEHPAGQAAEPGTRSRRLPRPLSPTQGQAVFALSGVHRASPVTSRSAVALDTTAGRAPPAGNRLTGAAVGGVVVLVGGILAAGCVMCPNILRRRPRLRPSTSECRI
jgi:hypothetical protein